MEPCWMLGGNLDGGSWRVGKNGYMYMYSWVPLLFTWNCHNIVLISYTSKQNKYYVLKKLKKKVPLQVCNYSRSWVRSEISALPNIKKVQFSSVTQLCLTLCDLMDCSTPGFPVHYQLPEFTQTHVHQVSDAIQPSHPLSSPFPMPLIFPSIRVYFNESVLCIRWPKC